MQAFFRHFIIVIAVLGVAVMANADNFKRLSEVAFNEFGNTLNQLETRTESEAIQKEIEKARQQIVHGKLLLRAGRTKKAAEYAERLHVQVELIRALISAAETAKEHDAVLQEILEMESSLQVLRYRLNRLRLEMGGKRGERQSQPTPDSDK